MKAVSGSHPENQPAANWPLIILVLVCTCIEAILVLADWGFFGPSRLRRLVYENAGYWPGLLQNWLPNYTGQPYLMFLTYGFLHSGPAHLIINMITLYSLGRAVLNRGGTSGFLLLYIAALVGGAVGYGL
mgnify:CR=1 FL=1